MQKTVIALAIIISIIAIAYVIYTGYTHIRAYLDRIYISGYNDGRADLKKAIIGECNRRETIKFIEDL